MTAHVNLGMLAEAATAEIRKLEEEISNLTQEITANVSNARGATRAPADRTHVQRQPAGRLDPKPEDRELMAKVDELCSLIKDNVIVRGDQGDVVQALTSTVQRGGNMTPPYGYHQV